MTMLTWHVLATTASVESVRMGRIQKSPVPCGRSNWTGSKERRKCSVIRTRCGAARLRWAGSRAHGAVHTVAVTRLRRNAITSPANVALSSVGIAEWNATCRCYTTIVGTSHLADIIQSPQRWLRDQKHRQHALNARRQTMACRALFPWTMATLSRIFDSGNRVIDEQMFLFLGLTREVPKGK